MSRDDFNDPGAATWGNPGAVTVGYIPEEAFNFKGPYTAVLNGQVSTGITDVATGETKMRFETSPQRDHSWRELKIANGKIEDRDLGDENDAGGA